MKLFPTRFTQPIAGAALYVIAETQSDAEWILKSQVNPVLNRQLLARTAPNEETAR